MNKYIIDVILNTYDRVSAKQTARYVVFASGYKILNNVYSFFEDEDGFNTVKASFPVNNTIIKEIIKI